MDFGILKGVCRSVVMFWDLGLGFPAPWTMGGFNQKRDSGAPKSILKRTHLRNSGTRKSKKFALLST